jgi:hypothetical protein
LPPLWVKRPGLSECLVYPNKQTLLTADAC